jgi:hypothetical protein
MMRRAAIMVLATGCVAGATAQPASASIGSAVCGVAGIFSGLAGKACSAVSGPVGGVVKKVLGGGGGGAASKVAHAVGLAAVGAWALQGAKFALSGTSTILAKTTSPQLRSSWFSATYWRMTAIAALLTLPFLFAAAVQALMRSDLAMLARAAFGYLPLAMLAISIAAPLTMLLLAASDEMSTIISSAAGPAGSHLLRDAGVIAGLLSIVGRSPFFAFVVAVLATAGALVLWLELAIREAAVYVVVLMLPLAFAAMVWPARRVWAIRAVELLVALILSKFAIVAVLTLGGGAVSQLRDGGIAAALAGVALLILGAFAPWALLRLLPLSELASSAAGTLGREARTIGGSGMGMVTRVGALAGDGADDRTDHADAIPARMRSQAQEAHSSPDSPDHADGAASAPGISTAPGDGTGDPLAHAAGSAPPVTNGSGPTPGGAPEPAPARPGDARPERKPPFDGIPRTRDGELPEHPIDVGAEWSLSPSSTPEENDGPSPGEHHNPLPAPQPEDGEL